MKKNNPQISDEKHRETLQTQIKNSISKRNLNTSYKNSYNKFEKKLEAIKNQQPLTLGKAILSKCRIYKKSKDGKLLKNGGTNNHGYRTRQADTLKEFFDNYTIINSHNHVILTQNEYQNLSSDNNMSKQARTNHIYLDFALVQVMDGNLRPIPSYQKMIDAGKQEAEKRNMDYSQVQNYVQATRQKINNQSNQTTQTNRLKYKN